MSAVCEGGRQGDMSRRAVIYARVSYDDRKSDGMNLGSQLEMGREYAAEHGYTIIGELPEDDRGASGAEHDLPELNKALEMAQAGEFDVLVVRELDRFARGLGKQIVKEEQFKRAGVAVEYALYDFPDTPEGQLNKEIRAVIASYERTKIAERLVRGRRNRARAGNIPTNNAPYGYRIVVIDDNKRIFEIYEPEARIVSLIFQWYTTGDGAGKRLSMYEIAKRLTDLTIPTWADSHGRKTKRRGKWYPAVVGDILRSETYTGKWHYGRMGSVVKNPREHWITIDVPRIIDDETWQFAQSQAHRNKNEAKRNVTHDYLLRYRVRCACGYAVGCQATKMDNDRGHYLYYRCISMSKAIDDACGTPRFRADQVDPVVWAWIGERMSDPDELRRELENHQVEQEAANTPLRERLTVVNDLLAENRGQLERLLDLYISGEFPKEMLTERKMRLETTIAALEREQHAVAAKLEARTLTNEQIQSLEAFAQEVERAFAVIDEDDFDAKREMIERLGVMVTIAVENGERVVYVSSPVLGMSRDLSVASSRIHARLYPGARKRRRL